MSCWFKRKKIYFYFLFYFFSTPSPCYAAAFFCKLVKNKMRQHFSSKHPFIFPTIFILTMRFKIFSVCKICFGINLAIIFILFIYYICLINNTSELLFKKWKVKCSFVSRKFGFFLCVSIAGWLSSQEVQLE